VCEGFPETMGGITPTMTVIAQVWLISPLLNLMISLHWRTMSHWKRTLAGSTGALLPGRFPGELPEVVRVKVPEGGIPVEAGPVVVEEPGGPEPEEEGVGGAKVLVLAEAEVPVGAEAPIGVLVVLWLVP
jgi:hypothetical protein